MGKRIGAAVFALETKRLKMVEVISKTGDQQVIVTRI